MKQITFETYTEGKDPGELITNEFIVDERNLMDTIAADYAGKLFGTFVKKQIESRQEFGGSDAAASTISAAKTILNYLTTDERTMFDDIELNILKLAKKVISKVELYGY